MRKTTDRKHGKTAAIISAAVVIVILGIYLAAVIFPLLGASYGEAVAVGILIVFALVIIAVIVGILIALRQRLKEIEGGEEDEAKQY